LRRRRRGRRSVDGRRRGGVVRVLLDSSRRLLVEGLRRRGRRRGRRDVRRREVGTGGAAGGHGVGAPPWRRGGRLSLSLPAPVAVVRGVGIPGIRHFGLLRCKRRLLLLLGLELLRGRG